MINRLQFILKSILIVPFLVIINGLSAQGTCSNPIPITCGAPVNGTTVDGTNVFLQYGCSPQAEAGKEKVYSLVLTQASDITATLSNLNGQDLDVHILNDCDETNSAACIVRGDNAATAINIPAGTYYIIVDGYTGNGQTPEGTFTLEVTCTSNSTGPTTGICSAPIAITCGVPFNGNTTGYPNNLGNYNCSGIDKIGPEVIHTITSPGNGTLTATLTRQSGEDLEVGILNACNETSCLDITSAGVGSTVTSSISNAVAGQQYYIVVDGDEASDFGTYTLEVTCPPSSTTGDCANPIALTCGTPFNGTTVDGSSVFNSYGCDPSKGEAGKEKIHTITLTQASDITASLSNLNGQDLDVHILNSCDPTDCVDRADNIASATGLAAGVYYIVVDGYTGNSQTPEGTYTLEIACTPNSIGQSTGICSSPIALTCGVPFNGNTTGYPNNLGNYTCSGIDKIGPEVIHTITAPGNGTLTATLTRQSGEDLEVGILSACNETGCLDITSAGVGSTVTASIPNAVAGQQYFIVVDGDEASDFGTYTLEVTCPPSSTTGDCTNPIALTCGTPFTGTTVDGGSIFNSYSCDPSKAEAGKEKIHTIILTQPSDISVALSNLNGQDLDVHILNSCDPTDCVDRDDNIATGTGLAAGTYYIVVDGYTGGSQTPEGAYTVEVTCTPNGGVGGTCSSPIALTCGTPFSGNTTGLTNEISNYNCGNSTNVGPDAIHTITSPGNGTLTATLTLPSGIDMEVAILSSCAGSSCLDKTQFSGGTTKTASISNAVAGQQYFVVVDGDVVSDFGAYSIEVTCPPSTQTGDCSNPIVLACGTPFSGTTVDGSSVFNSYSCDPSKAEAAKEKIHTITLTQPSDITAALSNLNGQDLDIHILNSCDPTDCVDRDDNIATGTGLAAGTYYIVVDGFTGGSQTPEGAYTVEVTCTPNSNAGTCADPIVLACGSPFSGNTTGSLNNLANYTCSGIDKVGPEVIHTITSPGNGTLTATLTRQSGEDLEVGILSSCTEGGCLDITSAGIGSTVTASISNAVAGQQYFIVVDGDEASDFGTYTLEVTCPPSSTTGDCSAPIAITCGTPYNGTTADGSSVFNTYGCDVNKQEEGKEKVHTITLTQASDITASLTNLNGIDLDVHILSSCATSSCIDRADNIASATNLTPGTYYIVVDGFGPVATADEGSYTLEVSCTPATTGGTIGTCANPIPIACGNPINGTTVDGSSVFNTYGCDATKQEEGKEKVHTITLTQASDITASLSNLNGNDLDVHILSSCATSSCINRGDNIASSTNLAPGTYYIVVDGFGPVATADEGSYTLEVNCTPVTTGNGTGTCASPIPLACGTPINGTTADGSSVFNSYGCDATKLEEGKEKVHTITLTQASDITASLSNLNGNDLDVHILSSCATSSCIDRADNVASATNLAPGTYYIVVDGFGPVATADEGTYTLEVSCTPVTVGGSGAGTCGDPIALVCGTPINGTTADGVSVFNSYGCDATKQEEGKEKVHTITLTQASDITASLSNLNGNDLDVHILSSCATSSCIDRADNVASATNLAPGTYYIVVDGFGPVATADEGTYTLEVSCTPTTTTTVGPCTELFFSEYVEGSSNNKAVEIYNPTAAAINLSSYRVEIFSNGGVVAGPPIALSGSIAANSTFVIVNNSASTGLLSMATIGSNALSFNGDDAIVLLKNTSDTVDIIGVIGQVPAAIWNGGGLSTANMTIVRKSTIQNGVTSNPTTFDPSVEWDGFPVDDFTNIGSHTSSCSVNPCVDQIALNETICEGNSYAFDGQTLTTSGTYTQTLSNAAGCDSITTLQLTVSANLFVVEDTICAGSSYILGSQTLTATGTYDETFQNAAGCDSTILLDLTVLSVIDSSYTKLACTSPYQFGSQSLTLPGQYTEVFQTSAGCDSTVTLTISFGNVQESTVLESICQGDVYTFGNQSLTSTGSYTEVFSTSNGCDSTVNLTLTVKATPIITISESNGDLVSSNGTSYQWFLDGVTINNDTLQNTTPTSNGVYTVETTAFNGCSGTGTYDLQNVSVKEHSLSLEVAIVPNPTNGIVSVKANENVSIIVYNLIGEIVFKNEAFGPTHILDLTEQDKGVYMVKVINSKNIATVKRVILN